MTKTEQYFDILTKMLASVHYEVEPTQTIARTEGVGRNACSLKYNDLMEKARLNAIAAMNDAIVLEARQARIDHLRSRIDIARDKYFKATTDEMRATWELEIEDRYKELQELYEKEV